MTLYNQAPINVPINLPNDTDDPIELSVELNFPQYLLERSSDYVFAITRIEVPNQQIQTFVIDDNFIDDYFIAIKQPLYPLKKIYWPNSSGMFKRDNIIEYVGVQEHFGSTDVLNTINSLLFNAFHQAIVDHGNYVGWGVQLLTFDGSDSYYEKNNMMMTFPASSTVTHVEFELYDFVASKVGGGPFEDSISIIVTSPDGKVYRPLIINNPDDFNWNNTNSNIHLTMSDRGFRKLQNSVDTGGIQNGAILYYPNETSLIFASSVGTLTGNWEISVTSNHGTNFVGHMNYGLIVYYNNNSAPTMPVTLSTVNKQVSISYQQRYPKNSWQIMLSPKINTMINFQPQTYRTNNMYTFDYPFFPNTDTIQTYIQNRSSLAQMHNLDRIGVYSFDLPLSQTSEMLSNNITSQIVTDFIIIDTSDDGSGNYIYTLEQTPWRYYELTNPGKLIRFNLEVKAIYNNQTERPILINPGDMASLRCTFFPRSQSYPA